MPAPASSPLSTQQVDDLVTILARYVTPGNIKRFGSLALGRDIAKEAGNDLAGEAFVRCVVEVLAAANKLWELIGRVTEEAHKNSDLSVNLSTVLSGGALLSDEQTQAFTRETQHFFQSAVVHQVENAVCAIGLGNPVNRIVGSGFLVGPALVMTNYHVLKNFLRYDPVADEVVENGPGDQIFCFFDYVFPPAPDVPPVAGRATRYVTVRALANGWLKRGRIELANDGTDGLQVKYEYDYVVIGLQREIGNELLHPSGGDARGWLSLPDEIYPVGNQSLLLVQHPEGAPRVVAMGDFDSLDDSGSRVRYFVDSDKGSSGSPTVGPQGVFALHNATVRLPAMGGRRRNQGVRIDRIVGDLAALADWRGAAPAAPASVVRFWSLNDDLDAPLPIIGRSQFVTHVSAMRAGAPERVLIVSGPPGSGRHFSVELLQRYLGTGVPVAVFTPEELAKLEPVPFLKVLMAQLGVVGASAVPIPVANPHEDIPQWLGVDLPKWLFDRLAADEARLSTRYPAWIVIDLTGPPDAGSKRAEPLRWAEYLRDFLIGLAGVSAAGNKPTDIPQLRWLVLADRPETLALTGVKRREEDLSLWPAPEEDFKACLKLAWRSIGVPDDQFSDSGFLTVMNLAESMANNPLTPRRQRLAESVARLVVSDPRRRR